MGHASERGALWAWLALFLVAAGGCARAREASRGKPVIAVSIFPLASLVEQLTGDWAEVVTLLPASASPHNPSFTPDQLRAVARADVLIVVGMGLDPWAEKAATAAESPPVLRFSDLIGGEANKSDPPRNNHLWLDPVLTIEFVEALSARLKERYPDHAAGIQSAAERLLADLRRLDREYAEQFAAVPRKDLITFHNAFDLIAERYHLNILVRLTDIETSPGGEVTPDKIREALEAITKFKLKVLYAETEFPDQAIRRLRDETADETSVDVLLLDPQGNPAVEGYRTYQQMMRSNLKTLVKGQSE
jgi:ABC-type Zn uptake system ZnuABC Zn-binding protein ZnuA